MISPRNFAWLSVLAAGAVGSWYLARPEKASDSDEIPYESLHRGYYLKSARILGTADNGGLLYEIEADHAEQQTDNSIEFTRVRVRYSPDSDIAWTVNADEATIRNDNPRIALRGHVRATSNDSSASDEMEIRTQYLELDPDRFVAETNQRVQVRVGARSLTATGMLASLKDDTIELKSNVRGKIAP